jgi:hypothetical protein
MEREELRVFLLATLAFGLLQKPLLLKTNETDTGHCALATLKILTKLTLLALAFAINPGPPRFEVAWKSPYKQAPRMPKSIEIPFFRNPFWIFLDYFCPVLERTF